MNNYLYHHGVKGMKWGVRKQKKYIKKINKQQQLANKYRAHQQMNKLALEGLYRKGPKSRNFGNEVVRLNKNIKQLDKYASYRENKVKKLLQKDSIKNAVVFYDVTTGTYSIKQKK